MATLIATDKRRVIIGMGVTGLSCARYLASKQLPFLVMDSRAEPPNLAEFKKAFPDIAIQLGGLDEETLLAANEMIISPGVSLAEPAIKKAIAAGVNYCGDIDLFQREVTAPIVAITGSNGKSTVTELVGKMAKAAGKRVAVGGNIGVPVLDLLAEKNRELYVLELSSFQLERAGKLNAEVATVLNISADHMDRYDSLVAYHQAKHKIFSGCKQVVVNAADMLSKPLVPDDVKCWSFSLKQPDFKAFGLIEDEGEEYLAFQFEKILAVSELKMVGRHNLENALAALALGHAVGLPFAAMKTALKDFQGLPHRCQYVDSIAEVKYYNDSKATNVGASLASIEGLKQSVNKIVLIAGGADKGADFTPLKEAVTENCRAVILMGVDGKQLEKALSDSVDCCYVKDMAEAVLMAKSKAVAGDAVLLAPACASFDQYDSYQQRGQVFVDQVATVKRQSIH